MTRTRTSLLVLPALALALTACGGDDGGGGSALSKEDYITQADAICTELTDATGAFQDVDPTMPEQVRDAFADISGQITDAAERLAALEAPEADAAELREKFIDPVQEQADAFQGVSEQVTADVDGGGDGTAPLADLGSLQDVPTPDEAFLTEYGFQSCADDAA